MSDNSERDTALFSERCTRSFSLFLFGRLLGGHFGEFQTMICSILCSKSSNTGVFLFFLRLLHLFLLPLLSSSYGSALPARLHFPILLFYYSCYFVVPLLNVSSPLYVTFISRFSSSLILLRAFSSFLGLSRLSRPSLLTLWLTKFDSS